MARVHVIVCIVWFALLGLIPATAQAQSYLQAPAGASYNVTPSGFTVECWARVRSEPGPDPRIIRCVGPTEGPCGNSSVEVWELYVCRSSCTLGIPHFGLQHAGVCYDIAASTAITDGSYHHLAATYDGTLMSIYVDGVSEGSLAVAGLNVFVSGGKVVVGNSTAYNNAFDGQVDEVRIWSVARAQGQIASAMSTEIASQLGLAGYWRLNGDGTDLAGGNTLVANGAVAFVAGELNQAADIANPPPPPPTTYFLDKVDYDTGNHPASVAIGDLNGDGKRDLAVANESSNTVSVLLGNGDGTFANKVDHGTGDGPISVAIGDLNGDNKTDLVAANSGANTVSVLLGNGDGSFATKVDYATGGGPLSVAIGDLNGDGKPDLVVADYSDTVSVLINNGDGTLAPKVDYGAGSAPRSVAIGDLNGDGKPDVAVANQLSNTVSVLLGNGDGTFADKVDGWAGTGPFCLAMADLNRDGKLDLLVTDIGFPFGVIMLLGNGDGTFAYDGMYAVASPFSVAIGDFNRDTAPDFAVANSSGGTVSVLLGHGDGTFSANADFGAGQGPNSVATGDLNGDGKPDIAVANYYSNTVSILLNTGSAPSGVDHGPGPAIEDAQLLVSPNPGRGTLRIAYALPPGAAARIDILDVSGRHVSLVASELGAARSGVIAWVPGSSVRQSMAPGIYLMRMTSSRGSVTRRFVWLR